VGCSCRPYATQRREQPQCNRFRPVHCGCCEARSSWHDRLRCALWWQSRRAGLSSLSSHRPPRAETATGSVVAVKDPI
jgi:hypothetical protein